MPRVVRDETVSSDKWKSKYMCKCTDYDGDSNIMLQ